MGLEKVLDIDELYREVENYDLVLTAEASLADALNARLEETRVGGFAFTPRRLAFQDGEEISFRRQLFLEIVRRKNLSWKQASYLLDAVISCWRHTGELEKILDYSRFDTPETRDVIEVLEEVPNPYNAVENHDIQADSVAVIGLYQFDALDRKILPEEYDEIEIFVEDEFELPSFNIFSSASGLVNAVVENASPDDTAVVVEPDSRYQALVESALKSKGIEYQSRTGISQDQDFRTFITMLRSAFSKERLRLRDVRPVLEHLEVDLSVKRNNRYLSEVDHRAVNRFKEFLNVVEYMEFDEALEGYQEFSGREVDHIMDALEQLELTGEPVSESTVSRLEFFVDSFDFETRSSDGVLLVSPKSSVFVDRSVVYYLGMDSSWMNEVENRPWIDSLKEEEANLKNFKALIQNGDSVNYMVQDREFNEEIAPCFYFNEIFDIQSFTDFPHERFQSSGSVHQGFETEDVDAELEAVETVSQTDLNLFVQSPKAYYFSQLVREADQEAMIKGNIFHDFAEFCANEPGLVEEKGLDRFIETAVEKISPVVDDNKLAQYRTEFRIGMENIVKFLENREPDGEVENYGASSSSENVFAEEFDAELDADFAEAWFENVNQGGMGKVDLLLDSTHLVDYKSSGYARSPSAIVRESNVDLFDDNPDFQPILYIANQRENRPGEKLRFTYFYFLSDINGSLNGDADYTDSMVTVTYYPCSFESMLPEMEVFEMLIRDVAKSNNRRKMLEKLGYPQYRKFMEESRAPDMYDKQEVLDSSFAEDFVAYAKSEIGDYKYVKKGCEKTLKKLVDFRTENYFKEDVDRFEEFLNQKIGEINRCRREGFPVGNPSKRTPYGDMMVQ